MSDDKHQSGMWRSDRGYYGCGFFDGDLVRWRGKLYITDGFAVGVGDGFCGFALLPQGGTERHPKIVDARELQLEMTGRDLEWQKLREFAP